MAMRATQHYWRSTLTRLGKSRSFATAVNSAQSSSSSTYLKAEFAPIYIVGGMVVVAVVVAIHTAKQQLVHSPPVSVNKRRRECIPEVEHPDSVVASADKFVNKSFLRKVAHIQENKTTLPDTTRPNPFTRARNSENLNSARVEGGRQ